MCAGLSDSGYIGHLYVRYEAIDPPGGYYCGAYTTKAVFSVPDCSFSPPSTPLANEDQAQACLQSLKVIATSDGVACPF